MSNTFKPVTPVLNPTYPTFASVTTPIFPPPGTDGSGAKQTYLPVAPLPGTPGAGSYAI